MYTKNKVLNVMNDGKRNNQLWMSITRYDSGQFWKLTKDNDWYRISPMWPSNKSIDIANDGRKNNHPYLSDTGDFSGQHWKLTQIMKI
jgi:hypothetical protein